ncbi:MAG: transcription-repair coupling factor [Campylobacteraceae bacterium 4484_4]|nr:MAG: transcription-repair coupling factor [Campylobacteraceae bacterium 4484_4]
MQARLYEYFINTPSAELLIVRDEKEAKEAGDLLDFLSYTPIVLPDFRVHYGEDLRPYREELTALLEALERYYHHRQKKRILIAPLRTALIAWPKEELFAKMSLAFAQQVDLNALKERMLHWGYSFVEVIQEKGEVSFRGDIIDIFPVGSSKPYRISLFDDEIESIRRFDLQSQKSEKEELEEIILRPALFGLDQVRYTKVQQEIAKIKSDAFERDLFSLGLWALGEMAELPLECYRAVAVCDLKEEIAEIASLEEGLDGVLESVSKLPVVPEAKRTKEIAPTDIKTLIDFHKEKRITLLAANEALLKQADLFDLQGIEILYREGIVNLITSDRLILSLNRPRRKKRRRKVTIVLDELRPGDYVVHENYGVGIFQGLKSTKVLGVVRDFVEIAYQGEDRLLVPVENLEVIDRYVGEGGALAVVDRLGKGSFQRLKAKAREKLFAIAREIVEIAAKRELIEAPRISVDHEEIALFQNDAGFLYTEDQVKSIEAIFGALRSGHVMDMLLSGDVGFGKTEVAMNAIFATVKSGYQAAFVAPTTLLVSQHFKSLRQRMEPYGIKIAKLDRFVTPAQKREVLRKLREGTIDLCIGTHALFGAEFANLALLILDEEHKFGVKQKEKLKNLKEHLHVLSMSATPIPRSLNMALSSIKQYAQLLTPPAEREDVRTFVKAYDEQLLKEVILREKRRGGQIFFIHNRIASIEAKRKELQALLPDLKILVLHSKVPPATTEKEILAFEEGGYDLLLSTSIVESGIHLPNVNTMIVEEADRFGMADLHQLRGRVGRGARQGYCYFLVRKKESLSEESKKRLLALESNSYLGSGSVLAYHDLEIRGGGNLIGEAQSGHIKNIGYSLYLKMLEDAINQLMGRVGSEKREVEIKLSVSAYLSPETVGEDRVRLELYRRLSKCQSAAEVYEIEEEMIDRFGRLDTPTKQFLEIIVIKILAASQKITQISSYQQNITVIYEEERKEYLKAPSRDDDDILATTLAYLRKEGK